MVQLLLAVLTIAVCTGAAAGASEPILRGATDFDWRGATVSNGIKRLALHGDRGNSELFVERAIFPAGYAGAPHTHPVDLHVVVIRGVAHLGIGTAFDKSTGKALGAGGYGFVPANLPHYEWYDEDTEVQMTAVGPMATSFLPPPAQP